MASRFTLHAALQPTTATDWSVSAAMGCGLHSRRSASTAYPTKAWSIGSSAHGQDPAEGPSLCLSPQPCCADWPPLSPLHTSTWSGTTVFYTIGLASENNCPGLTTTRRSPSQRCLSSHPKRKQTAQNPGLSEPGASVGLNFSDAYSTSTRYPAPAAPHRCSSSLSSPNPGLSNASSTISTSPPPCRPLRPLSYPHRSTSTLSNK